MECARLKLRPFVVVALTVILFLSLVFITGVPSDGLEPVPAVNDEASETSPNMLKLEASASSAITVYFFWAIGCSHCTLVKPYIDSLEQKYPQVTFLRLEIAQNSDNRALYSDFNHRSNVQHPVVPSVFVGDEALIGEDAIKSKLEPIILRMLGGNNPPVPTKPGEPTSLSYIAGDGQVKLSWKAPSNNGGATIDHYVVYQNGKDVSHVTGTTAVVKGLSNGVGYNFAVAAHNSAGIGTTSSTVKATPSASVQAPGAPTGLGTAPGDGEVRLQWQAPADDGGATIDHYVVYQNGRDVAHINGMNTTMTGLTNGMNYDFSVAAHNSAGTGPQSYTVSVTPAPSMIAPGPPTNLTAMVSDGKVLLAWNAPVSNGGAAVMNYNLSWSPAPNGTFNSTIVTGTNYLHEGLENVSVMYYWVAAMNVAGEGERSEIVTATLFGRSELPPISANLSATFVNGSVSLDWNAPVNGGGNITSYSIFRGVDRSTMEFLTSTSGTEFLDDDVLRNETYFYQVKALNGDGEGDLLGIVNVTIASDVPRASTISVLGMTFEQAAIVGLSLCGVGIIGLMLWSGRRL